MVTLNCCKNKMCFDPSKIEIAAEKLVCNNQEGKEEKLSWIFMRKYWFTQLARIWERTHIQVAVLNHSKVAAAWTAKSIASV